MFGSKARRLKELEEELRELHYKNDDLRYENMQIKVEKHELEEHLKKVLPIVEHKDFKPALSKDCYDCVYGVLDPMTNAVIGCRKDNVCSDFKPEEE